MASDSQVHLAFIQYTGPTSDWFLDADYLLLQ